jgi:endoglucanase
MTDIVTVYLGYIGWAAGSLDCKCPMLLILVAGHENILTDSASYALAETPTSRGEVWTDTQIVTQCLVPK